ncbi:MAG TPA: type II toxin-antitoxin system HicB family antitoxin [Tepidiformaceae bacterium]|nr:type II toxin-antitoxin system HicB family antitoxin [Tepidiformaceae bacterium]
MTDESRVLELSRLPYHRVISGDPVEGYIAEVAELPGCLTAGETPQEALSNLEEALLGWLESAVAHGDPIPEPFPGQVRLTA